LGKEEYFYETIDRVPNLAIGSVGLREKGPAGGRAAGSAATRGRKRRAKQLTGLGNLDGSGTSTASVSPP